MTTLSDWPVQGAKTVIMEQLATVVVWKAAQNARQDRTVISARYSKGLRRNELRVR